MFKSKILIVLSLLFLTLSLKAQDSTLVHSLLERIAKQQVKQDTYFLPGIFPSYITMHSHHSKQKKDNNIFYNALIDYTLQSLSTSLDSAQRIVIQQMNQESRILYPKFKNKKGRNTYNFWRTDTSFTFPYTRWIPKVRKHVSLPDDLDDTVLSLMALNASDSSVKNAHVFMQTYVNKETKPVRTSIKEFKKQPAYSVWYGKKFPVIFDVCVLSNILTFVQKNDLVWTKADSASLQLIVTTINNKYHLTNGINAAPYYIKPSIQLYHFARLMSIKRIDTLEALKPQLAIEAIRGFHKTNNLLEKILLSSALMKWGYAAPELPITDYEKILQLIDEDGIAFFVGNIPSYLPKIYRAPLQAIGWGLYEHHCPAYNEILLLEYLLLRQSTSLNRISLESLQEEQD